MRPIERINVTNPIENKKRFGYGQSGGENRQQHFVLKAKALCEKLSQIAQNRHMNVEKSFDHAPLNREKLA
jgi:hypothetical protein